MKIIRYQSDRKGAILAEALVTLLSGGTVVYPTETAYGLGADFYSPTGYRSVYSIKYRNNTKPLPVLVPDMRFAATLVEFPPRAVELASKYWPGPLTLVLPFIYYREWPHHVSKFLGVRVSSNPLATSLSQALGHPLISTSANISGKDLCYTVEDVISQFKGRSLQPDLVIDVGPLPAMSPSTIVKVSNDSFDVLRQGAITVTTL